MENNVSELKTKNSGTITLIKGELLIIKEMLDQCALKKDAWKDGATLTIKIDSLLKEMA